MTRALLTFLGAALVGCAMVYIEGPGLLRDVQLRNAALVPALDLKVEEARCRSHWWVVSNCSIKYSAPQSSEKQSIYFSVFGTLGGERFQLMRGPDNRTVTADVAVAKLTNRVTSAIFFIGLIGMVCFFSLRAAVDEA